MNETALIWRLWTLFKYGLAGFLLLALCMVAFAEPPKNRPPDNRPPDKSNAGQPVTVDVDASSTTTVGIRDGDVVQEGGSQTANQTTNVGGETPLATATVGGSPVSVDTGDSPISVDTGGNKHESNFFALSTTFPNGHGCFGGAQGGGAGDGGGGWFGMHWLNWACFSNYVSDTKKSIKVKARLDCSARGFRNAIAFDVKKNRQQVCVTFMETEYKAQIDFEKQQVMDGIANGTIQTYAMSSGDNPDPK